MDFEERYAIGSASKERCDALRAEIEHQNLARRGENLLRHVDFHRFSLFSIIFHRFSTVFAAFLPVSHASGAGVDSRQLIRDRLIQEFWEPMRGKGCQITSLTSSLAVSNYPERTVSEAPCG